jgi:hypothetical protein
MPAHKRRKRSDAQARGCVTGGDHRRRGNDRARFTSQRDAVEALGRTMNRRTIGRIIIKNWS